MLRPDYRVVSIPVIWKGKIRDFLRDVCGISEGSVLSLSQSNFKAQSNARPCTTPVSASAPMCTFIPKCHSFPFFTWCISGSRSPVRFFVDAGASMMLASTIVPSLSLSPRDSR